MPPQAGFVSEWYVFETVFQGFRLDTLPSRLVMALAGAGLALTVADRVCDLCQGVWYRLARAFVATNLRRCGRLSALPSACWD